MRTAPTATRETKGWRMNLARYVELKERYSRTAEKQLPRQIEAFRKLIPKGELGKYLSARRRNLAINRALLQMAKHGAINYLVIGADDAQKFGPQYPEA